MIGVFAVDPGGSTGLAWGIFNPKHDIGDCLRGRLHSGSTTIEGEIGEQISEIAQWWQGFYRQCVRNFIKPEDVWLVVENFTFTGANYGGDSAVYSTAIIWGLEGYRMGARDEWNRSKRGQKRESHMPPMILQTASQGMSQAKRDWLKEWNCWIVGKEHERSAFGHVAYFLKHYQNQGLA